MDNAVYAVLILFAPTEWFDPAALPTVTTEDVSRFGDAILAIQHDASAGAIEKYIAQLESMSWAMNGCRPEYEQEVNRLRWTARCWDRLEMAYYGYPDAARAKALDELRRLIGPQMFYAGRMPPFPPEAMPWCWPKAKQ